MGVIVDGKTYPLQASKDIPVLHSGTAPSGSYNYAKLNQANAVVEKEPFQRHLDEKSGHTPNEFYNRTWNTQTVAELPKLMDNLPGMDRVDSPLHAKNQIPTIYLTGDQAQIDLMHGNTTLDTRVAVDMHFIETDKITTVKDVEIKVAGQSTRLLDKLSYGLKIKKDQDLYGYRGLKLRALRFDPSYIREILCFDMMESMGLPVSGASYTRVIMNDQPIGLFLMIEAYKNDWYKNEFGGGKKLKHGRGATYQVSGIGGDLSYFGDNITAYDGIFRVREKADKKHGGEDASNFKQVMDFTKFLSEAPTSSDDAAKIWNEHIDMDSVIRSLVIEIIAGFSDGYIANTNNFFLYDNLAEKRLTYLAADFDMTIGNTLVKLADMWAGNYTQYPGFTMRPLTQKMMQVPEFKSQFEQLLLKASKELINEAAIHPRIDDLVKLIREDVEWDTALPKVQKMAMYDFVDFNNTEELRQIFSPPVDVDAVKDMGTRIPEDLDTSVYKQSDHISLPGVTQWFSRQSKAIQDYFTQHPLPPSLVTFIIHIRITL
ncbi:coth protein-domain-containing protein [Absidia repens]|uniref:Coth protein-domain-containing protein n=1 Tax=Absidia repens TaxID=90262 RepID=A0A1X2ILD8_9FUNG|nr:coth protein-domain-containing protein [Absidia repens]